MEDSKIPFDKNNNQSPHIGGDLIDGDKVSGDKVQGDKITIGTFINRIQTAPVWFQRLILALLTAVLLGVGLLLFLQIRTVNPPRPSEDTASQTVFPSGLPPLKPPPIVISTTVALRGCDKSVDQGIRTDIENSGGQIVESAPDGLNIAITCQEDNFIDVAAQLPRYSNFPIEYLDEDGLELSLRSTVVPGRAFIRSVTFFAAGDFENALQALRTFTDIHIDSTALGDSIGPDATFLLAQTLLHEERWEEARDVFEMLLASSSKLEQPIKARAFAGMGISYVLERQMLFLDSSTSTQEEISNIIDKCRNIALQHLDEAVQNDPTRALWQIGSIYVRYKCNFSDDQYLQYLSDANDVLLVAEQTANPYDLAHGLILSATMLIDLHDDPNRAQLLAQTMLEESTIQEERLPSAYSLLSCIVHSASQDRSLELLHAHLERLSLPFQRRGVIEKMDSFCF